MSEPLSEDAGGKILVKPESQVHMRNERTLLIYVALLIELGDPTDTAETDQIPHG